ncbi:MAG TPA: hypothetical protein DHV36_20190 [Desulfobacteraceae bacterium]|nr:hypothetical protein [Desulfobacteraceae bacterium]
MTIDVSTDRSADLTIFTVKGSASFEDLMAAIKRFYDKDPTANVIWNLEQASVWDLTVSQIEKLANYTPRIKKSRSGDKTAFVASDDITITLSNLFIQHGLAQKIKRTVKIFNSRDNALAWIKGTLQISAHKPTASRPEKRNQL